MFRAITITEDDESTWIHLPNVDLSNALDQRLDDHHYTRTLAAQSPETPELLLATVNGADWNAHPANLFATSVARAFGRDWSIHGPAIVVAVQDGNFINLTDEIWSWIINVHSGLVAAPVEPLEDLSPTSPVLADIHVERMRQIAKFGEQHREDGSDPFTYRDIAARTRRNFLNAEAQGGATWHQAIDGPFYESISETDPAALRSALVELAAVACAWIEDIDSRKDGAR